MKIELNNNEIDAFYQRQSQTQEEIDKNLIVLDAFISSISTENPSEPEDYFDSFTQNEKLKLKHGIYCPN